ncbi:hypothetical protein AB1Y20_019437 [Prymnesium parvum]|uniref:Uncharacterized protein n=1 Tax=Prymnesium parvum TaxID=97485 RepID=A0AB34JV12_PRYPA
MLKQRPAARGAAPSGERVDVSKILRDVRAGSSAASADAKTKQPPLAEENAQLRREVAELRKQLMGALSAPTPPGSTELAPLGVAWISAQVEQSKRQVQVLSEALVQRLEISTELEAVLLKLRQPAADGTLPEGAEWAASAMRRLRHVQFAEELAENLHSLHRQASTSTKGGATIGSRRCVTAGRGSARAGPGRGQIRNTGRGALSGVDQGQSTEATSMHSAA